MKPFFSRALCLLLLGLLWPAASAEKPQRIRFVVYSDLHHDLMPGGPERLQAIVDAARRERAELMISLGDLVFPKPENQVIPETLARSGIPQYHAMGNHDMDQGSKNDYMRFVGMNAPYYHFDRGLFRFVVLDTNFFTDKDGREHPYDRGNYFAPRAVRKNIVDSAQQQWLEGVLSDPGRIYLLFCHAPSHETLQPILRRARDRGIRVAAVFEGHLHGDRLRQIDGVNYLLVNSASYIWGGESFESRDHYPPDMYRRYGNLHYIIPYAKPLYAVVEVSSAGKLTVRGVKGDYMEPRPDPVKLHEQAEYYSPSIANRTFRF